MLRSLTHSLHVAWDFIGQLVLGLLIIAALGLAGFLLGELWQRVRKSLSR